MIDYYTGDDGYMHMNFMAQSPLRLFFAEITLGSDVAATLCTIVEPGM